MLLFMVMPALFGGFGNLIINTLYLTNYINYNNITNSLIQNNTKNTITTFNNDNNNQQHPQLGSYLNRLIEGDGHIYTG